MCCIFTCCGWMIDLIQRLWTFVMSCCISSAVCCLLVTAAMAGIALGYNYSLAEFVDLKESNVSIYLKRGIFDDEIADLQLRRANEETGKAMRSGGSEASDEGTTMRSGRRLDDSVFESGDQNKYEGSLMKLTARPAYEHSTQPHITEDFDMQQAIGSFTKDSLDALKAVQSVIDARRAYAQTMRGPTISPVPSYPFNDVERIRPELHPEMRRMMGDPNIRPSLSPARLAVPNSEIGAGINWIAPLAPDLYREKFKEIGLEHQSTTFPSPITFNAGPIRPTPTMSSMGLLLTKFKPITLFSTRPTIEGELTVYTNNPRVLSFKEKLMAENDRPIKKHRPKSDEDYDYDVKGLPVRKRRSINLKSLAISNEPYGVPFNDLEIRQKQTRDSKDSAYESIKNDNLLNQLAIPEPFNVIENETTSYVPYIDKQNNTYTSKTEKLEAKTYFSIDFTTKASTKVNPYEPVYQNVIINILTKSIFFNKILESFQHQEVSTDSNKRVNDTNNLNNDIPLSHTQFINKLFSNQHNAELHNTK